ncbi:MAG: DMT family transporter [Deltaproteobacteria bacterium]|nr:DMT family transporter [Deltaproteobacteria bacterium]
MRRVATAYIQLASAMIIVGSSVVAGKLIVASFPVFLASGLRFVVGNLILIPLVLKAESGLGGVARKDWLILFFQSLSGVFLFNILLLYGLKLTSAAEGGIITSTTPAVVGIISFLFLKERLTPRPSMGILLAVLGVVAVNVLGADLSARRGLNPLLGNLMIFGAVVGEALFIILRKAASESMSALATAALINLLALFMFAPLAIYEALGFDFSGLNLKDWLAVIYYGVMLTVVAYYLWFKGLRHVPASTAGVFTGLMPISAVGLSYIVLAEPFRWAHLAGGLCVLAGIGLMTVRSVSKKIA